MNSVLQSQVQGTLITRNPRLTASLFLLLWLVVLLPVTQLGLTLDDLVQRQVLLHDAVPWWRNLFIFLSGQPDVTNAQVLSYGLPWWTDPNVKIAFFRPLASFTHWLDYQLWPTSVVLMHLHNVLWYGVACALVLALYRRVLPASVALLASVLFVADIQHITAISWIASRNSLIAASFSVLAMLLHLQAIRKQQLSLSWLAAATMLLGLLAAEAGSACAGYLLGLSLFVDRRQFVVRLLSLLPFGILGGVWLLYYFSQGYGSAHTGFYNGFTSGEPLQALVRLPFLAAMYIGGAPGQFWPQHFLGPAIEAVVLIVIMLVAAVWLLRPLLRVNPMARCLLLGALVALLPVANCAAAERNLLMFSIGGHGLLALVLAHWWQSRRLPPAGGARLRGSLCWILAAVHLLLSPLAFLMTGALFIKGAANPHPQATASRMEADRPVVIVRTPTTVTVPTIATKRRYLGLPTPEVIYPLASSNDDVIVVRKDSQSIEVTVPVEHDDAAGRIDLLFRNTLDQPLRAGDEIRHGEMLVTVEEVGKYGMPKKFTARFDRPLDQYQWVNWSKTEQGLQPFMLPGA